MNSGPAYVPTFPGALKLSLLFMCPMSTVVFPRHPRVAKALYNHQDALRQWAAKHQPSCRREAIKRPAPEAPTYDGHAVASGFHFQCGLSTLERQVISGSSGDTFSREKLHVGLHVGTISPSMGIMVCHQRFTGTSPESSAGVACDVGATC